MKFKKKPAAVAVTPSPAKPKPLSTPAAEEGEVPPPRRAGGSVDFRPPASADTTRVTTLRPLRGRQALEAQCARLGLHWAEQSADPRSRKIVVLVGELFAAQDDESLDAALGRVASILERR